MDHLEWQAICNQSVRGVVKKVLGRYCVYNLSDRFLVAPGLVSKGRIMRNGDFKLPREFLVRRQPKRSRVASKLSRAQQRAHDNDSGSVLPWCLREYPELNNVACAAPEILKQRTRSKEMNIRVVRASSR